MAYASASDVAALCRNLIKPENTFTTSTCPTDVEVDRWLTSGCARMETKLTSCKYSVPPASGTTIYDWLTDLNALYAAGMAHRSRLNATITPDERTVGDVYLDDFTKGLDELCDMDLTSVGLSRASTGTLYVGGISVSDKQTQEQDTDRVQNRFFRGAHRFAGTIDPTGKTAS